MNTDVNVIMCRQQVTCCLARMTLTCRSLTRCDETLVNAVCQQLSALSSLYMSSMITSSRALCVWMLRPSGRLLSCICPSALTTLHLCFCALQKTSMIGGLGRQRWNAGDTTTMLMRMMLITLLLHQQWCTLNRISHGRRQPTIRHSSCIEWLVITVINSLTTVTSGNSHVYFVSTLLQSLRLHTFHSSSLDYIGSVPIAL